MQAHTPDEVTYYTLPDLLPDGQTLALNTRLGTLSLIVNGLPRPRLVAEQQFTPTELAVLLPLLDLYPAYCPYETMKTSFDARGYSAVMVERTRLRLNALKEHDPKVYDREMRTMRNALSLARAKMRTFRIEICTITEVGYTLLSSLTTSGKIGVDVPPNS